MDAEKASKDLDDTFSDISGFMSKAYSDITTNTQNESLYKKWEGIIKSGVNVCDETSGDLHFFDRHAFLKLQHEDDNLKVVKDLQHELN